MSELRFNLPTWFVNMLSRRHNGNQNIDNETRAKSWYLIQKLYDEHKKYSEKLRILLDVEWEEQEIEKHYCDNIFKNAHLRLKSYENRLKNIHKTMFFILTKLDGIQSEFSSDVISVEEIYLDFKYKYVDKTQTAQTKTTQEKDE